MKYITPCLSRSSGFFFQCNQGTHDDLEQEQTSVLDETTRVQGGMAVERTPIVIVSTQSVLMPGAISVERALLLEATANPQH